MAAAVTDVKGDRARRPSAQSDPDMYLHIVDRRPDGIVVRGAKAHISSGPIADELIVIPTRALTAEDADYAVAFAIPVATKGIRLICRSERPGRPFDYPISGRHYILESLTVFDDVFVPWERVFLAGEWQHAGAMANLFAQWHRFTALSYKTPIAELLLGTAILLARANGIERARHIREHLVELAIYLQMVRALGSAAAIDCTIDAQGIANPNELSTNLGKYYFAERYHDMVRRVQEIAGGLMVTAPGVADALNEVTGPAIEKYLAGADGWGGIDRTRLMKLARDLTASDYGGLAQVAALHAEGSTEAQRMTVLRETDVESLAEFASRVAGIGTPLAQEEPVVAASGGR
jgi:aromatic ring hydroxylase